MRRLLCHEQLNNGIKSVGLQGVCRLAFLLASDDSIYVCFRY